MWRRHWRLRVATKPRCLIRSVFKNARMSVAGLARAKFGYVASENAMPHHRGVVCVRASRYPNISRQQANMGVQIQSRYLTAEI